MAQIQQLGSRQTQIRSDAEPCASVEAPPASLTVLSAISMAFLQQRAPHRRLSASCQFAAPLAAAQWVCLTQVSLGMLQSYKSQPILYHHSQLTCKLQLLLRLLLLLLPPCRRLCRRRLEHLPR